MALVDKLQIKPGQRVAVLNLPDEVDLGLTDENPPADDPERADVVVLFVADTDDLDRESVPLVAAARRDALAWVAYPKGGRLGTDLNRDSLNAALMARGVRGVRQVAIDDTWSALRFRPQE